MAALFLAMLISITNPKPILLQSVIDSAQILGLPRLKIMDRVFATKIWIDDLEHEIEYLKYSRIKFLKDYIKSGKG